MQRKMGRTVGKVKLQGSKGSKTVEDIGGKYTGWGPIIKIADGKSVRVNKVQDTLFNFQSTTLLITFFFLKCLNELIKNMQLKKLFKGTSDF